MRNPTRTSSHHRFRLLSLLALLALLASLLPALAGAQEAPPEPAATPPALSAARLDANGAPIVPTITAEPAATAPLVEVAPAQAVPEPAQPASTDIAPAATVQGVVQLDVSAPAEIRAGDLITYTYTYTNTGSQNANNVIIQASWTGFNLTPVGDVQHCTGSPDSYPNCTPLPGGSPGVTKLSSCPSAYGADPKDICYGIGALRPGDKGQFSVRLGSNRDRFPRTREAPVRPAGGGRLYINDQALRTSEDSATTLIAGPVLVLRKRAADPNQKIYATETGEFIITYGNAINPEDKPGGQMRADARPATEIVLTDRFPAGSSFVSANPAPTTVDTQNKRVIWRIAGPLNPDQQQDIRVTFRKDDVNDDCDNLNNGSLNITSKQYPTDNGNPLTVGGDGAGIGVIRSMRIEGSVNPGGVPYGGQGEISLVVRNYWNQPLTGVLLHFDIQTNATYVAGSANPAPIATPTAPGERRVTWRFDIGAGTKTAPKEATFRLGLLGGYTSDRDPGIASIVAPSNVPRACIESREFSMGLDPRLFVEKSSPTGITKKHEDAYIVKYDSEFPYEITVSNRGPAEATGVEVLDVLPAATGANFSYVPGSGTFNGSARNPDQFTNGAGGSMRWQDLRVPAGGSVKIGYRLRVLGLDYYRYCNGVSAKRIDPVRGEERINYGRREVCVKIMPEIALQKTVDKPTAQPGEQVIFTLTLTNRDPEPQTVGLYDFLDQFTFVSMVSGYDMNPSIEGKAMRWKRQTLQTSQQLTIVFKAQVPSECKQTEYTNEVMFWNNQDTIIRQDPPVVARVRVNCGGAEYQKDTNRDRVSLGDRFVYTLVVRNTDGNPKTNIEVLDLLPQGFSYIGLDPGSGLSTAPRIATNRPDGRTDLRWTIPTLRANSELPIRFIARAGGVVGEFANLMVLPGGGKCTAECGTPFNDGVVYSQRRVRVEALATMEPKIIPDTCAAPGSTRTYQLTILNTNNHDYTSTTVAVKLPLGLSFVKTNGSTPKPVFSTDPDGFQVMSWSGLRVPAKPDNAVAAQVILSVDLKIGQVLGDLSTTVQTDSPDGIIPRREGVVNPTVRVCPTKPQIAKTANTLAMLPGGEIIYQITLANPTANPITTNITDNLPRNVSYAANLTGPAPTVNASTLTWTGVTIPAAAAGSTGTVLIRFKALVAKTAPLGNVVNTATASSTQINPQSSSVTVLVSKRTYLVSVRR